MNKKKIIFALPDLTSGGAERVMSFVANSLSKEQFNVELWAAGFEKNTKYDVSNIKTIYFNKVRVLKAIPCFYSQIRKSKPDIVISSISHLNIVMGLLSIFYPKTKFIGREANVLSIKAKFGSNKNKIYNLIPLTKICYKFLDIILCQSKDMYQDMKLNYGVSEHKLRLINNPISDNFKLKSSNKRTTEKIQFITIASLKKQKGHERIIKVLSKIDIPFKYTIVGDGPENHFLFNLISELGIKDKIEHVPYTNEVSKYLSRSDFFLQGSFVEGFPNSLIESCAVGTPVIAYKAPGGLNEIIEEGINGFVANNDDEFLKIILKAADKKDWDSKIVSDSVYKKFNKEKIIKDYENLFLEILNDK